MVAPVTTVTVVGGAAMGGIAMGGAINPLASLPPPAERRHQQQWTRHTDGTGDVWYTNNAGETAWHLPPGAVCLN